MDQMGQWFNHVDTDRSGQLDYKELQRALQQAQLNFSTMSCHMLLRLFDPDRSGKISLPEFRNLFQWIQHKDGAFFHFDNDRSGSLDHGEIYRAVMHAYPHLGLDQHAFYAAVKAYDPDQSGTMSRTEFVGFCAYLEMCHRTFISFDTQRTGSVQMGLSQFIYACSQAK
ncbi:Penta-EF hand domain-containing protein 1 [Diplonema papillatum]|nr:Penta-EF hand domain-containing protein 1 [Diplonema papillatum]